MSDNKRIYENLGLTKDDVIVIQKWLFPMIYETATVSGMIKKAILHFNQKNIELYYALYLIGSELGQAGIKEQFGMMHTLDTENT